MLLFIPCFCVRTWNTYRFQYISCYSLSLMIWKLLLRSCSFNTSHVTLYRIWFRKHMRTQSVSIHLMLLFIAVLNRIPASADGFNTSHVTLYRQMAIVQTSIWHRFNTSHVTLYQWNRQKKPRWLVRFNTSHVTLYPLVL